LYQALGASLPQFIHIPLIVGADRARLSKRQGATSVNEYRAVGYLPEAFVNYLALLGWSPGGNREVVEPQELVQAFELSRVRKTAAQFDQQKLDWLNSQHLKRASLERLTALFAERLIAKGLITPDVDRAWLSRIAKLLQDRIKVLSDVEDEHGFFFTDSIVYQEESVAQFLRQDGVSDHLLALKERLGRLPAFDTGSVERATRELIAQRNLQAKDLIHPARVALTGRSVSPPLFETMAILGREKVLSRLEHAATQLVR
ncbi:MAG: glutamate--tRNA ligase, partial [Candidatus Omnitrophica bacterium]|nr:glutamate--tRNA ligase [Candidatus Omnitrophota bacterium]